MGTASNALGQLLRSLCHDSVWNYAVLWKLRHGSPMILNWEDGYFKFNHPKPREFSRGITDHDYFKVASDIFSQQLKTDASTDISEEYSLGHVLTDMSQLHYVFGEGAVGRVAAITDHCWASFNNVFSGEVKLIPECPEEWLLQFASGIKTILLVPVLPHGVLQLGSMEEVAEDINIVAYVKDRSYCLHHAWENTTPFSLKKEFQVQPSSQPISCSMEYLNAPSTSTITSVKTEEYDHLIAVNMVELGNENLAAASQVQSLLTVQDTVVSTGEDFPEAFISERENKIDVSLGEVSSLTASTGGSQLEMMESKLFELSCLMEELQAYSEEHKGYSDCNDYDVGVLGDSFDGIINFHPADDIAGEPCGGEYAFDTDNTIVNSFLRFPMNSELHKALEPAFREQTNAKLGDSSSLLFENSCTTSSLPPSKDPSEQTEPSWFTRGGDAGYLLEAVIANACSGSDDTTFHKSNSVKPFTGLSGQASSSPKPNNQASILVRDDSKSQSHLTSACISEDKDADATSDTLGVMMRTIFSKEHEEKGSNNMELKKGNKTLNSSKRRARPGDSQRPRPRDRQLIQDRVKELRELVPNGAKCSIDGLLDRTIKHMMYLRSVTDRAERLRQCVDQERTGCKSWSSSETKENYQNGTSWAFEIGNEFQECPIAVEDLAHPGHMLIEMLCNEHGLFLEIAQVIRGLELNILKGVLESRSNNTWARFVVEASKGFHRLDIFWPLMQLLQRKRNSISSKI